MIKDISQSVATLWWNYDWLRVVAVVVTKLIARSHPVKPGEFCLF